MLHIHINQYSRAHQAPPNVQLERATDVVKQYLEVVMGLYNVHNNSEAFILRVLRHVREACYGLKRLPHQEVLIHWTGPNGKVTTHQVTPDGDIQGSLAGGFFTWRATEL